MQKKATVHLKIDTGMGRIGIQEWSAHKMLRVVSQCSDIIVEGMFGHLANADTTDLALTKLRLCVSTKYYKQLRRLDWSYLSYTQLIQGRLFS